MVNGSLESVQDVGPGRGHVATCSECSLMNVPLVVAAKNWWCIQMFFKFDSRFEKNSYTQLATYSISDVVQPASHPPVHAGICVDPPVNMLSKNKGREWFLKTVKQIWHYNKNEEHKQIVEITHFGIMIIRRRRKLGAALYRISEFYHLESLGKL